MSSDEIVIDVKNLSKRYEIYATPRDRLKQLVLPALFNAISRFGIRPRAITDNQPPQYFREFWALHDVSFQVRRGETVGIVGLNGSGKSTLLQLICSTLTPTTGNVEVKGRVAALLELGSGFNPDYTGRENVYLNGQILGLNREEIQSRFQTIEAFADIGDFIDQPVKTYSSGMVVRLAFAVAINIDPDILVVDEALAVGDIAFQRKCLGRMEDVTEKGGTLFFVSHSAELVRRLCSKAVYLSHGKLVGIGSAKDICDLYEKNLLCPSDLPAEIQKADLPIFSSVQSIVPDAPYFPMCAKFYGDGRASIANAWLEDGTGKRRSTFQVGEHFFWCFKVCFTSDVPATVFGLKVKTKEGVELFSTNSLLVTGVESFFSAGREVVARFKIKPNLGVGDYFLNCSVGERSENVSVYVCRVIDAGILSVISSASANTGLVNMEVQFTDLN